MLLLVKSTGRAWAAGAPPGRAMQARNKLFVFNDTSSCSPEGSETRGSARTTSQIGLNSVPFWESLGGGKTEGRSCWGVAIKMSHGGESGLSSGVERRAGPVP